MAPLVTCSHCGTTKFGLFQYSRHLKQYHECQPGFKVECNYGLCKSTYSKVNSFVKHVIRNHKTCLLNDKSASDVDTDFTSDMLDSGESAMELDFEGNLSSMEVDVEGKLSTENPVPSKCSTMQKLADRASNHCVSFVLGVREKHLLPSTVQEHLVSSMQHMVSSALSDYRDVILYNLQSNDVQISDELKSCLDFEQPCSSIGKHVESEYSLLRYLKETDQIVMPQTMTIDSSKPKQTLEYVSILQVLTKVLGHDDVISHFSNRTQRDDNVMEDFCDGELYKSDPFFEHNPTALRIHLYSDEFEVCNPIGAKKGKHKIVAFYYTIGNFHPKLRSQTRLIFLALLVKHRYLQSDGIGYHNILRPLLNELECLQETGITVMGHTFKGKMVSISADNLSAHVIGGFQQHFHSGRICRTCLADHSEIACKYAEEDFKLRTADVHSYHINAVESNQKNSNIYGVKGPCSFSVLMNDAFQRFPHDIMHDLLEGVLPLTTRLILQYFVKAKQITLTEINATLAELDIAYKSNKPNQLTVASLNSHITDVKMQLCLGLLPVLFGEKPELIYVETEERIQHVTPCVVGSDSYNVKVDGTTLLLKPTVSFKKVLEVWFSSFWILSIKYPEKLAKTCQFIEKILLNKGGKTSEVVRKWANRLL